MHAVKEKLIWNSRIKQQIDPILDHAELG